MSTIQAVYALITIFSFVLGIIFIFFDGTLLWPIGFFVLSTMLILIKITWNIAGWAERVTRKLGEE